jgi:hypothetical protein
MAPLSVSAKLVGTVAEAAVAPAVAGVVAVVAVVPAVADWAAVGVNAERMLAIWSWIWEIRLMASV